MMETTLENVSLFCDKYNVRIYDMEDAYYNRIIRQRRPQVSNNVMYDATKSDLFIVFCN